MSTTIRVHLPRLTRDEAAELFTKVAHHVYADQIYFGGSYCRELETCGDVDIAVLTTNEDRTRKSMLEFAQAENAAQAIFGSKMGRYFLRINDHAAKVDIWYFTDIAGWGASCMFLAGDGLFNTIQRAKANRQGYTLSQYGLFKNSGIIPAHTEEEVYQHLGWPWVPHKNRSVMKK